MHRCVGSSCLRLRLQRYRMNFNIVVASQSTVIIFLCLFLIAFCFSPTLSYSLIRVFCWPERGSAAEIRTAHLIVRLLCGIILWRPLTHTHAHMYTTEYATLYPQMIVSQKWRGHKYEMLTVNGENLFSLCSGSDVAITMYESQARDYKSVQHDSYGFYGTKSVF